MSQIGHIKINIEKLDLCVSWERGSFPSGACQYYYFAVVGSQFVAQAQNVWSLGPMSPIQ